MTNKTRNDAGRPQNAPSASAGANEAQDAPSSETVPGGLYLDVDGKTLVNANGEPLNRTAANNKAANDE